MRVAIGGSGVETLGGFVGMALVGLSIGAGNGVRSI